MERTDKAPDDNDSVKLTPLHLSSDFKNGSRVLIGTYCLKSRYHYKAHLLFTVRIVYMLHVVKSSAQTIQFKSCFGRWSRLLFLTSGLLFILKGPACFRFSSDQESVKSLLEIAQSLESRNINRFLYRYFKMYSICWDQHNLVKISRL